MLLDIIGALIHFIFLTSIYDLQRRNEVYTGTWKNCSNEPISKRLVLYLCDGLDTNETINVLNYDSFLYKMKKSGTWGITTGTDLRETRGLTAVVSGFEEQSKFFASYEREKIWDNLFNYVKRTIFIGRNNTLKNYENTNSWTNIILEPNVIDKLTNEKQQSLETINQIISHKLNIKEMNNVLIVVYMKNETTKLKNSNSDTNLLKNLDTAIESMTLFFQNFFADQQTTFILNSYKTPLMQWRKKRESFFTMWGNKVKSKENIIIRTTDINVIISVILGNPIPLNSIGRWHNGLLNIDDLSEAKAKACNAFHLASVANAVLQQVGNKILNRMGLSFSNEGELLLVHENQLVIDMLKNNANIILGTSEKLIKLSAQIIDKDIIVIRQIINYLMHFTYIGWSLLLVTKIIKLSVSRDIILKHEIKMMKRKTQIWFFGMNIIVVTTGGLCILFVLIQGWPFYYMMYCLPTIIIWGYVLNYLEYWIAFLVKMTFKKMITIIAYSIIYIAIVECYIWGISYNLVLIGNVLCISLVNIIICYIKKEYVGIKITTISSSLLLSCSVFAYLNKEKIDLTFLIPSGLIWLVGGLLNAIYMTLSKEILDTIVMAFCIIHYCISFSIVLVGYFYQHSIIFIIYVIQIVVGICLPLLGNAVIPATEIPQDIDRYKKSNRLHHICICFSSLLLLVSMSFETLFSYILYIFLLMWYFVTEPTIKIDTINKENAHYATIFVTLVILIQHVLGLQEPPVNIPYGIGHFFPKDELTSKIIDNVKVYLVVATVQEVFSALSLSSGGDEQLLLATFILNMCGYRLFMSMDGLQKNSSFKIQAHTSLQFIIICIFLTLTLTKVLLRTSMKQLMHLGRNAIQIIINRAQRNE